MCIWFCKDKNLIIWNLFCKLDLIKNELNIKVIYVQIYLFKSELNNYRDKINFI